MLKQSKSKKFLFLLVLATFFAAGYFYSNFRNTFKASTSTLKTATEPVPESKSPQSNTYSVLVKYYPLQKGNYWEYEGTQREQLNAKDIETSKVEKKVEVLDIQETEEGIVVSLDGESDYLIKGNDVYSRESWGDNLRFPFPLYVGQKWGDEESLRYRDDNAYVWRVEEKFSKQVLGKDYGECFKIGYKSNPDTSFYIFCYGLGIVEYEYKHNGTVLEWNYRLVKTNVEPGN